MHELTEIMRQNDDLDFAQLLNRLRENNLTENDLCVLHSRTVNSNDPNYPSTVTHLFTNNNSVDTFNKNFIDGIKTQKVKVKAFDVIQGDFSSDVKRRLIRTLPKKFFQDC